MLVGILFSPVVLAVSQLPMDSFSQPQLFQNWLLNRCIGKASTDKTMKEDAYKSASAWLEYSHLPVEAFNGGDKLIDKYLKINLTGSVEGNFKVLTCTLLSQSKDAISIFNKYTQK